MERQNSQGADSPAAAGSLAEQRGAPRFDYGYIQGITLIDGETTEEGRFFFVTCNDFSRGGFSFYLDSEPDFEELVATLGRSPRTLRLRARVAHVQQVAGGPAPRWLVGCRFIDRLDPAG